LARWRSEFLSRVKGTMFGAASEESRRVAMREYYQEMIRVSAGARSSRLTLLVPRSLRLAAAIAGCLLIVWSAARPVQATVNVEGNVLLSGDGGATFYADNPFTGVNEGIPLAGNSLDEGQGTQQTNFEGRPDNKNTADPSDDENVNFDIYVGRTSFGSLTINGDTELNDMNLIIGDSGTLVGSNVLRRGTGYVFIQGPGAVYNNDPAILPFPFDQTGDSPSINDRVDETAASEGFDLFVGRAGNGNLAISAQGRAEIQDAAIVGDMSGSVGTLTIDGPGSFLQSGGFETTVTDPNEVHYMVVGRLGSGTMSITNGGQSFNSGPAQNTGNNPTFAAVIGSNLAAVDSTVPGTGGAGTVYVDGVDSKWTLAGNLQIGGFHDDTIGIGPLAQEDLEGNLAVYGPGVGRGTLKVSNGALVSILPPPLNDQASNVPNRLDLLVGRFGRIELDNGRIELLGAVNDQTPQNPTQQLTRGRLINDGVVLGSGSISVLQFRNRVLGEVRVGAGQTMVIKSTGTYTQGDNVPINTEPEEYPLSNYGLIQVQGTVDAPAEVEFQRNLVTTPTSMDFTRPFLNLPVPTVPPAPNGRTGGEIIGQNSIMRFDSNIINRHKVSFTGGSNLVSGNFTNEGTFFVGGDHTTVTFVDEFINAPGGTFQLEPSISLVMFLDDLTLSGGGSLNTSFGGRPTGQEISMISGAETITLGGTLNATLFTAPGVPGFTPQAGDQFAIINAAGQLIDDFNKVNPPSCVGTICFVGFKDSVLKSYFIRAFDFSLAVGGDFDGDGIVDELDFNVWKQNFGKTGVPGTLPGDANHDGVVDGVDFIIFQNQFGGPPMAVPGAGAGGLAGANATVPEPESLALVLGGAVLALAVRRTHQC
jgi:T5SS/PEP-CTERM-associated repeat protein